jgi:hypothetical protein
LTGKYDFLLTGLTEALLTSLAMGWYLKKFLKTSCDYCSSSGALSTVREGLSL